MSYKHISAYSSLLTKKQNPAARKILRFLLRCRHRWGIKLQHTLKLIYTHNQGYTLIHMTHKLIAHYHTPIHATVVLIVGVVLLFRWSPLMDHRPLKQVSPLLLPLSRRLVPVCMSAEGGGEEILDYHPSLPLAVFFAPYLSLSPSEDCRMISVHDWQTKKHF